MADRPAEAALKAREIQLDPLSTATVFSVDRVDYAVTPVLVDLMDIPRTQFCAEEQEIFDDLSAKVQELLHGMVKDVDSNLVKLAKSGSGVLEAHNKGPLKYAEPRKVLVALLRDMQDQQSPYKQTTQFKADVINYQLLL